MALNTSAQSSTLRHIGPILSMVQVSAIAPCRLTRPNVGRRPVTPHAAEGEMMEPRVSVPSAKPTSPAAVAAPDPADDPLEPRPGAHGLRVMPPNQTLPRASAPIDSLATSTAPASARRSTTVASRVDHLLLVGPGAPRRAGAARREQVLGAPRNPVQRPAVATAGKLPVGRRRLRQRGVLHERDHGVEPAAVAPETVEVHPRQVDGRHQPALDQSRQGRHRLEGELLETGRDGHALRARDRQGGVRRGPARREAARRSEGRKAKAGAVSGADVQLPQRGVPPPVARDVRAHQVCAGPR